MLLLLLEVDLYEQTVDHHHNGPCLIPWEKQNSLLSYKFSTTAIYSSSTCTDFDHKSKFSPFFTQKNCNWGAWSHVCLLCRDLVSVHIIYEYERYLLPPPSSWHQWKGKTTRDYHNSNEYSILTRRPTRNIQLSDSSSSLSLSLSLVLSLQKLRRNFRIKKKKNISRCFNNVG